LKTNEKKYEVEIVKELTEKQKQSILYMVYCGYSHAATAELLGIRLKDIRDWLKEPYYIEEYNKEKQVVFYENYERITGAVSKSIDTLIDLLDNEIPQIRLNAAKEILSRAGFETIERKETEPNNENKEKIAKMIENIREKKKEEAAKRIIEIGVIGGEKNE